MPDYRYFFQRLTLFCRKAGQRFRRLRKVTRFPFGLKAMFDMVFATLDLMGVFDLYEAVTNAIFPAPRPLREAELRLLRPIFGDGFPYDLIRIDERAYAGPCFFRFCYVSFYTINSWGPMSPPTLIHEVVHVWQYTQQGALYIPRALYAQTTEMGYNYGGLEPLKKGSCLEDFNYEQQADIIEDAFRIANGWPAQWVQGVGAEALPAYYPYLREVRS